MMIKQKFYRGAQGMGMTTYMPNKRDKLFCIRRILYNLFYLVMLLLLTSCSLKETAQQKIDNAVAGFSTYMQENIVSPEGYSNYLKEHGLSKEQIKQVFDEVSEFDWSTPLKNTIDMFLQIYSISVVSSTLESMGWTSEEIKTHIKIIQNSLEQKEIKYSLISILSEYEDISVVSNNELFERLKTEGYTDNKVEEVLLFLN